MINELHIPIDRAHMHDVGDYVMHSDDVFSLNANTSLARFCNSLLRVDACTFRVKYDNDNLLRAFPTYTLSTRGGDEIVRDVLCTHDLLSMGNAIFELGA